LAFELNVLVSWNSKKRLESVVVECGKARSNENQFKEHPFFGQLTSGNEHFRSKSDARLTRANN